MIFPLWFLFALGGSVFAAAGMFIHQRLGGTNTASAVWVKILAVCVALPVLLQTGLPEDPRFYLMTGMAAAIWCVNDLIYYDAVKTHGAALVARLSPLGLVIGFAGWFAVNPALLDRYLADLPRFAGIAAALALAIGSGLWLRRCPVSLAALRAIWFVIVGGACGILLVKAAVDYAPPGQAVFGYIGFEAGLMLLFYAGYFTLRRRDAFAEVLSFSGLRTGGIVAVFLVLSVICRVYAQKHVEHPALAAAVGMLDVVWLMLLTRLAGMKDDSNKIAGLGIVLAALLLAVLKIR